MKSTISDLLAWAQSEDLPDSWWILEEGSEEPAGPMKLSEASLRFPGRTVQVLHADHTDSENPAWSEIAVSGEKPFRYLPEDARAGENQPGAGAPAAAKKPGQPPCAQCRAAAITFILVGAAAGYVLSYFGQARLYQSLVPLGDYIMAVPEVATEGGGIAATALLGLCVGGLVGAFAAQAAGKIKL